MPDFALIYISSRLFGTNLGKDPAKKHFLVSNSFLVGQASMNWFAKTGSPCNWRKVYTQEDPLMAIQQAFSPAFHD